MEEVKVFRQKRIHTLTSLIIDLKNKTKEAGNFKDAMCHELSLSIVIFKADLNCQSEQTMLKNFQKVANIFFKLLRF